MAVGWFLCPYEVVLDAGGQYRRCTVTRFEDQVAADGGALAYVEILGDHGIAKVRASAATLTAINAEPGIIRIPRRVGLQEPLSDLTAAEQTAIRNKLLALGYTVAEFKVALGDDLTNVTLGQLLRFAASRWRRPAAIIAGTVIFEGGDYWRTPGSPADVDQAV